MTFGTMFLIFPISRTAAITITTLIGIVFGSLPIIANATTNASEADAEQYAYVRARMKDCRLEPTISSFTKDGRLDFGEYIRIRRLAHGYDTADQRERLTGRRTIDCRSEAARHAASVSHVTPERLAPFLTGSR